MRCSFKSHSRALRNTTTRTRKLAGFVLEPEFVPVAEIYLCPGCRVAELQRSAQVRWSRSQWRWCSCCHWCMMNRPSVQSPPPRRMSFHEEKHVVHLMGVLRISGLLKGTGVGDVGDEGEEVGDAPPSSWQKPILLVLSLTAVTSRRGGAAGSGGGGGGGGGGWSTGRGGWVSCRLFIQALRRAASRAWRPGPRWRRRCCCSRCWWTPPAARDLTSGAPGRRSAGGPSWTSSTALTLPSTVLRERLAAPPAPQTRLKVEKSWCNSPALV